MYLSFNYVCVVPVENETYENEYFNDKSKNF